MREIKFRAWDSDNRVMHHDYRNLDTNFKLMQYTGLKDKNGVEIYEGDIIRFKYGAVGMIKNWFGRSIQTGKLSNEVSVVVFDPFYAAFMRDLNGAGHTAISDDWMCSMHVYKVIGNIYGNPELLKDGE